LWIVSAGNSSARRRASTLTFALFGGLTVGALALGQTVYKYRDANGQWVFTDNAPPTGTKQDASFTLSHPSETLQNTIERTDDHGTTTFTAINTCLCVSSFLEKIIHSDDPNIPDGAEFRKILQPQSREPLVRVANTGQGKSELKYMWTISLGSPHAQHKPPGPYRAPFALGSTYTISQAYPATYTHDTPESQYAVDIALPDGTPVYAARDGMIINVRHDAFRGGASPAMMDQANVVDVLHDDGTIAVYGHLHWDSIQVHIGQQVARGQALGKSGSTGFSTGPHLHFVVIRNAGFAALSVPIEFAGPSGVPVTPVTGKLLTAY
jgi:murein DD-endopeptidase MepM/ murein hydrolase activator NlpD